VTNSPHCNINWARPTLRKKVDFPPRLAPVNDHKRLPVCVNIVSDNAPPHGQREADVAQVAAAEASLAFIRLREGD
jgi:hypothetical protein